MVAAETPLAGDGIAGKLQERCVVVGNPRLANREATCKTYQSRSWRFLPRLFPHLYASLINAFSSPVNSTEWQVLGERVPRSEFRLLTLLRALRGVKHLHRNFDLRHSDRFRIPRYCRIFDRHCY